jgi:hypothetical protein
MHVKYAEARLFGFVFPSDSSDIPHNASNIPVEQATK